MVEILHKKCGGHIANFLGGSDRRFVASTYLRLDGTHPDQTKDFKEVCPACNELVTNGKELIINE